jgi:predicted P-loop ATPase
VLELDSQGTLRAFGLAPDRYTETRVRRGAVAANFDWEGRRITFSARAHERPLADVRRDMEALGLAREVRVGEPEDHAAMLFDVMRGLIMGEFGADGLDDRIFFERHLKPWAARMFVDLEMTQTSAFYRVVGAVGRVFLEVEAGAMELAAWIGNPDRYTLSTGPELVMQCVETVARRRRRHTVREYLNSLKWDGVARVERMFVDIFSAADVPYTRAVAQNFMVSAVSRVLWSDASQPTKGSKVDFMVVLEGNQGVGKSTAVLELFGASWYAEATESPAHKDFYQTLRGRWCIEIGEMESFSKADVGKIKQAITTRFDTYRPSYGRTVRAFRRECVFVGTTNQDDYLRDATGARRFLPIKTGQVSIPALVAQRDQLWAEAVSLYKGGFEWWKLPPNAEREQDARYSEDVWTQRVWLWCNGKGHPNSYEGIAHENLDKYGRPIEFSISDVLSRALQVEDGRQGRSEDTRVGSILKKLK